MTKLLNLLKNHSIHLSSIISCEKQITPILQGFITNFPDYTDHSIVHSKYVLKYVEDLLEKNMKKLNEDEVYILIMAGFLHDIGMCPTTKTKKEIKESKEFIESGKTFENHLRDIHHEVSYKYIRTHWKKLHIIDETYAEAIALVALGHRVVDLLNFEMYDPEFPVKSGTNSVCLPYIAGLLRLADELDITNDRTPDLLFDEYLPTNPISKKEWDKHKANYFVTFSKQTIRITSKCFEKGLYFALLKQYSKIEETLKYVLKIIHSLPHSDRNLKIEFVKIEKHVKTIGFIPKEIGFSFDLQNTIDTFIGNNIYKSKYVALREVLQNAIDSCRHKKHLLGESYGPSISIHLEDSELTIEDNGMGMDEFIVQNYFAKLAKSYYTESSIVQDFESIGQFGIGVFSYFLLCDYFDVKTKKENSLPLKFRVVKEANTYFHFYEDPDKSLPGTSITFNLKSPLDFTELISQINHYIRFVEIPIIVSCGNNKKTILPNDFSIDKIEMLRESVDREHQATLNDLITIHSQLANNDCEGVMELLLATDETGLLCPIREYDTLKTYHSSRVEISQKGIYIGQSDRGSIKHILGKLNLKKKNSMDLGRYHLKNSQVIEQVKEPFYELLLNQLFNNWRGQEPQTKRELTRDLVGNYFEQKLGTNSTFIEKYFGDLYVKLFDGRKFDYISIEKLKGLQEFILVRKNSPFDDVYQTLVNHEKIYETFKVPLVLDTWAPFISFILAIFEGLSAHVRIRTSEQHWFFSINPTKKNAANTQKSDSEHRVKFFPFDSKQIAAYTNLRVERVFNSNHPLALHYLENKSRISNNIINSKIFDDFFQEMGNFIYKVHSEKKSFDPTKELMYVDSLLQKVNKAEGTYFKFSTSDFPIWINQKINWDKVSNPK